MRLHANRRQQSALFVFQALLIFSLAACANPFAPVSPGTTSQGVSEQVKIAHGQDGSTLVLVPVTIHGKGPFTFALDTGASTSLIDRSLAEQLGLPVVGGLEPISGIGGVEQAIPVRVSDWHAGAIRLPTETLASASLPGARRSGGLQGLLGSDIWSRFGTFTLDYNSGTLTVYKQIAVAAWRVSARRCPGRASSRSGSSLGC